jgi:chemotaxis protein methyltransferase WspC
MQRFESILRREIGLDATSIGSSVVERTLRLRMKHHALKRMDDYVRLLESSREEMESLIEAVVVTETWFMRGRESFAALADLAVHDWAVKNPQGVMRVLSLPCSSGEEPYSIAMTLLEAGFAEGRFAIDAVDISANALARAQYAVYGKNSFRSKQLDFRNRHFVPVEDGHALSPDIQKHVSFRRDNLLRDGFNAAGVKYDFVFCRNLLIYFDRETQMAALEKLRHLLTPAGVLFVGPAEMPILSGNGFVSANIRLAFASRKDTHENKTKTTPTGSRTHVLKTYRSRKEKSSPPVLVFEPATARGETDRAVLPLKIARQLADAGQLAEAAALCEQHIAAHDTCAEGYYLMGLVKDAADDANAIVHYRKAIYLEPNHYEALIHAALWLEKHGDLPRADSFKRRAERVKQQNATAT